MSRYWQSKDDGFVTRAEAQVTSSHGWIEVQIVPLDAIVIRREDLPEVTPGRLGLSVGGDHGGWDPKADAARWRRNALQDLALAEYLTANPPIDEAQVAALASVVWGMDLDGDAHTVARRLIATGKVHVDTEDGAK